MKTNKFIKGKRKVVSGAMSAILAVSLFAPFSLGRVTVNAEGTDACMNLGIASVASPTKVSSSSALWSGDYIYMGQYYQEQSDATNKQPVKWRVLDTTGANGASSEDGAVLLQSDQVLDQVPFNVDTEAEDADVWKDSDLANWLNSGDNAVYKSEVSGKITANGFLNTAFSSGEQKAIMASDGVDAGKVSSFNNPAISGRKIFILSAADLLDGDFGFLANASSATTAQNTTRRFAPTTYAKAQGVQDSSDIWIRSTYANQKLVVGISRYAGYIAGCSSDNEDVGVAPAMNVKKDSILFTSPAAEAGSATGKANAFSKVATAEVSQWKFTLKDSVNFANGTTAQFNGNAIENQFVSLQTGYSTANVTVNHAALSGLSSAYTNVTAALCGVDESGNAEGMLYYGSVQSDTWATQSTITLPQGLSQGIYKLYVQGEDRNGAKETDYASKESFVLTIEVSASGHTHSYGEWTNTTSCTSGTVETRVCSICQNQETRTAQNREHEWETTARVDVAATCTTDGSQSVHCKYCNETKDTETISATGHSGGYATCVDRAVCKVCNRRYGELAEHSYNETDWVCDGGAHWHQCTQCSSRKNVSAHHWNEGILIEDSLHTDTRIKVYECVDCEMERTDILSGDVVIYIPEEDEEEDASSTTQKNPSNAQTNSTNGQTSQTGSNTDDNVNTSTTDAASQSKAAVGLEVTVDGGVYKILSLSTASAKGKVAYVKPVNKKKKTVTISDSVTIEGEKYTITSIGKNAFAKCSKLKTVTIKNSVKTIGAKAFYQCKNLKKVTLGKGVTTIGAKAFYGCKKLTGLTIKTTKLKASKIGSKTFTNAGSSNYKKLTVTTPKKKKTLYKKMFRKKGLSSKAKVK